MTNVAIQPAIKPDFADLESRTQPNDHHDLRLWLRLQSCSNLIENEIRSRLRKTFQTTPPRFDLMAQLHSAPDGMKMSDLSRYMMVTNGNITGITDQLEKEGLVKRIKIASDRRSSVIRLTPKGKQIFEEMAVAHGQWIQEIFADIPMKDRHALFALLGKLKFASHMQLSTPV